MAIILLLVIEWFFWFRGLPCRFIITKVDKNIILQFGVIFSL
jgi:hypothetical protein